MRPARATCAKHGPRALPPRLRGRLVRTKCLPRCSEAVAKASEAGVTDQRCRRRETQVTGNGVTESGRGRAEACDIAAVGKLEGPDTRRTRDSTFEACHLGCTARRRRCAEQQLSVIRTSVRSRKASGSHPLYVHMISPHFRVIATAQWAPVYMHLPVCAWKARGEAAGRPEVRGWCRVGAQPAWGSLDPPRPRVPWPGRGLWRPSGRTRGRAAR